MQTPITHSSLTAGVSAEDLTDAESPFDRNMLVPKQRLMPGPAGAFRVARKADNPLGRPWMGKA